MKKITPGWLFIGVATLLLLAGLFGSRFLAEPQPEKVGVGITGYNFTNEGVQEFFVNGAWGSNLGSYSGGGVTCCVAVPAKWTPDLAVKVDWTIGHYDLPIDQIQKMTTEESTGHFVRRTLSKTVPIERYAVPSDVQVFFFPNDEIKVYSSSVGLGSHNNQPSGLHAPRDPQQAKEQ